MLNKEVESSLDNEMVNSLKRKLFKSKKGISPILATLLLVVIAVAAIVVTYAWVMMYTGRLTGQAGVFLNAANVNFRGNGTVVDIDVQNTGTSDTTIVQVYIGTSSSSMNNQTISSLPLLAGQTQRLTVDYSWAPSVVYYFKVLASTSQSLQWSQQAPNSYS
jgi:flagellin-like protein